MPSDNSNRKFALACDIGATKVSLSLAYRPGEISDKLTDMTDRMKEPESLINELSGMISGMVEKNRLSMKNCMGLGVAFAGPVNGREGTVLYAPNIQGWENVPLRHLLEKKTGVRVRVHNDANVGALGEYRHGGIAGAGDMLYITISTGIGAGIVIDGKPYEGANHMAGEIGHSTVIERGRKCGCGKSGCLETVASGSSIERIALERMKVEETSLRRRALETGGRVSSIVVFEEARKGDILAAELVENACRYLGTAISGALMLMDFSSVVLGGGVAREGEYLRKKVEFYTMKGLARGRTRPASILVSRFPDSVVDIGALELVFEGT